MVTFFSALYLGEIVRLIIIDLVQRSILFPGRMQKAPSLGCDYNIFLILRGSFYAKHVADIECDKSKSINICRVGTNANIYFS